MKKNIILTVIIVIIAIILFVAGAIFYKRSNLSALYASFSHTQCFNKKCISANGLGANQCSADSDCATHLECNNLEQCAVVGGSGPDKCSTASDCYIADPQAWCKSNNTDTGMNADALIYPDGNFTCECYYIDKDGTHSQTPCINSHTNQ